MIYLQQKSNNMAQISRFTTFNFPMLPTGDNTVMYNNELFLSDTFSSIDTSELQEWKNKRHPYKIDFAISIFCQKGELSVRLNLSEYTIKANELLILNPKSIGELLSISEDCQMFIIALTDNFYPIDRISGHMPSILNMANRNPVLDLSETEFQELKHIYIKMYEKLSDPDFILKKEIVSDYINIMFCNIYQKIHKYESDPVYSADKRQTKILNKFLELVQANCTVEREIPFYADKLCLSPKYMSQVIHKISGRHASQWIREFVILEAKALLKSGNYTVQQVADKLNFSNASFFGKYFKAATGTTPRKYQYSK